jgi:hypothetical protein
MLTSQQLGRSVAYRKAISDLNKITIAFIGVLRRGDNKALSDVDLLPLENCIVCLGPSSTSI